MQSAKHISMPPIEKSPGAAARPPFGALLRKLRLKAGLSQELLAEKARISPETVSALERGRRKAPQRETLALIASALNLALHEREELEAATRASRPIGRPRFIREEIVLAPSAARTRDGPPSAHNLPRATSSFHGREREAADLAEFVRLRRLVTLIGAGGVGKTRLAIEVARDPRLASLFTDGVWLVDLATIDNPGLIASCFAAALSIDLAADEAPLHALVTALRDRRTLIIADNCEHVLAPLARVIERLAHACEAVSFMSTSREALNIDGEVLYHVDPLGLPDRTDPALASAQSVQLAESPAVQLFIARATDISPAVFPVLAAADPATVAEICARLDGLPLALELAAARVHDLPLRDILAGLDDRFALLRGGRRFALPRQQTLLGMIGWSYDLLAPSEQSLFRRLGIFAADWTLDAAAALCASEAAPGNAFDRSAVRDGVAALIAKSLLVAEHRPGGPARFRLLESIRAFAREQLRVNAEDAAVAARHAHMCLDRAQDALRLQTRLAASPAALDVVAAHTYDMYAALDWSLGRRNDVALGAQLVAALFELWTASLGPALDAPAAALPSGDREDFGIATLLAWSSSADDRPAAATPAVPVPDSRSRWVHSLAVERSYPAGARIFAKGEVALELFYVVSGTVLLEEFDVQLGAGDLLGEVGFFLPAGRRTASARCTRDVTVWCVPKEQLPELFRREPAFRVHVLHVFARRMLQDLNRLHDAERNGLRSPRA